MCLCSLPPPPSPFLPYLSLILSFPPSLFPPLTRHSLTNEVINYVHTKGCIGFCIRNIKLSIDKPPLDLVEIFATIFCCLKDSSDISQVLIIVLILIRTLLGHIEMRSIFFPQNILVVS